MPIPRKIIEYGPSKSFHVGALTEGCIKCIKGEKIVLYTTGSCSVGCAYCPIPENKQKVDDVFVNEQAVTLDEPGLNTIYKESDMCLATGAGITGGDPMEVPDRTIDYIKKIRSYYGPNYHLHLYTSGIFFKNNLNLIDDLFDAGLDELRFHPKQIRAKPIWEIAKYAKNKYPDKEIGFEIPVIPNTEKDIIEMIEFADKHGLDFVNLNEYEFTSSNFNKLSQRGFVSVLSNSAIIGSRETAKLVIEKIKDKTTIPIHFCTSGSKDSIQLVQRFKKRAKTIKRPFDDISDEGELEYGIIYSDSIEDLDNLYNLLINEYGVEIDMMEKKEDQLIIETGWFIVEEIIDNLRELHFSNLQAEVLARHPIENGPITFVNPL